MAKYILTEETKEVNGFILHRIEAVKDFADVKCGDKGGWIEKEENLSHEDNAWIYDNASVYGDANVFGNAKVYGEANIYDNAMVHGMAVVHGKAVVHGRAWVFGNAWVINNAMVGGDAWVFGYAMVGGDALVSNSTDYIVFKNWWSSGRYFTWTRSNNKWRVGCFFGTGEKLIKKAYADSEKSGREYERIVKYVESILAEEE